MLSRTPVLALMVLLLTCVTGCANEVPGPLGSEPIQALRACAEGRMSGVAPGMEETAAHREYRLPTIDYPVGEAPDDWGLQLTLQVDATGRVVCYHAKNDFDELLVINPRRRSMLESALKWRYRPFFRDGKPVAALVAEQIYEQVDRPVVDAFPDVPLERIKISLARSGCYGTCPSYQVEIHGDGKVVYTGKAHVDIQGRHEFEIPRDAVSQLVSVARRDKIWGLGGSYRARITDNPTYCLTLQAGNETRVIEDYVGAMVGMPRVISEFEEEVDRVARSNDWIRLSATAVQKLERDGFEFGSKQGGDLLLRSIANEEGDDELAMLKLIELGVPLSGDVSNPMALRGEIPAMDRALLDHREQVVNALLKRGVLQTGGRRDQRKIDAAFQQAIQGGRLALVEAIWNESAGGARPALLHEDVLEERGEKTRVKQVPVTLLLYKSYHDKGWQGLEIARWLAEKGVDLKASAANGDTLLHVAVDANDIRFVQYLLAQGLDVSTPGEFDLPALGSATDEDIALLLLEAGSNWRMDDRGKGFLRYARGQHWGRVLAWVSAHPK